MKILEQPSSEPWTAQLECIFCGVKLEVEEPDVKLVFGSAGIQCPVCKRDFSIEDKTTVPARVYNCLINDIGKELKGRSERMSHIIDCEPPATPWWKFWSRS